VKKRQPLQVTAESRTEGESRSTGGSTDRRPALLRSLEDAGMSPVEEKVIRMRHGLTKDDDCPLGQKTQDPLLLEQLAEIELSLFRRLTGDHRPPSGEPAPSRSGRRR